MNRLLAFVRTGEVDGVGLGATEEDVRRRLGAPDDFGPGILRYGALQVAFHEGRALWILLTGEDATDLDQVRRRLRHEGIAYEVDEELTFDTQTTLRITSSGVRLTFDPEEGDRLVKAIVARS